MEDLAVRQSMKQWELTQMFLAKAKKGRDKLKARL
jgi:hypothetical protein